MKEELPQDVLVVEPILHVFIGKLKEYFEQGYEIMPGFEPMQNGWLFEARMQLKKVPNATTRKAIVELESGKGKHFPSVDTLMADLESEEAPKRGRPAKEGV